MDVFIRFLGLDSSALGWAPWHGSFGQVNTNLYKVQNAHIIWIADWSCDYSLMQYIRL